MFRFVALAWDASDAHRTAKVRQWEYRLRAIGFRTPDLAVNGLTVWTAGALSHFKPHALAGLPGLVLGEIYQRQRDCRSDHVARPAMFDAREAREILATRGRRLIGHYWGNYVALLHDHSTRTTHIVNDPAGSLPCNVAQCCNVQVVFSSLSDFLALQPGMLSVNWSFVRSRIANSLFEVEQDPLVGVSRVHRGECLSIHADGRRTRDCYWHPLRFDRVDDTIDDPVFAEQALRATVRSCTHTLAAPHDHLLQQTSGGLDSSIVLSALTDAPHRPEVTCYTVYRPGAPSDERRWARLAVRQGKHQHYEVPFDIAGVDFGSRAALSPSVHPASATWHWHHGPTERRLSAETNATGVVTGEGGDAVFCATSYVFAIDHVFARRGISWQLWSTALRVAARRDQSVWRLLRLTLQRRHGGASMQDFRHTMSGALQLLHPGTRYDSERFPNPWFSSDERVDLEAIWRLGTLAFAPEFYDLSVPASSEAPSTISPLCTQPVYEICRRIPVDLHFVNGRIRGLARNAFAGLVPEPILRRQWKDRPTSQPAEIVQHNRQFIRDRLLDGHLTREHILDRTALELALGDDFARQPAIAGEILSHLDMELWLQDSRRWAAA